MATKVADIHPHIISSDTRRYPLAPLGGEQSGWSQKRPVSFEQLIAAMDQAGVHALECFGVGVRVGGEKAADTAHSVVGNGLFFKQARDRYAETREHVVTS